MTIQRTIQGVTEGQDLASELRAIGAALDARAQALGVEGARLLGEDGARLRDEATALRGLATRAMIGARRAGLHLVAAVFAAVVLAGCERASSSEVTAAARSDELAAAATAERAPITDRSAWAGVAIPGAAAPLPIDPSDGCGLPAPAAGEHALVVDGEARTYMLTLPADYSASKPLPVVFDVDGILQADMPEALYVSLVNADPADMRPFQNIDGRDVELARDALDAIESEACVDRNRVFATGFSRNGVLSYSIAGGLGSRIRAIAPISAGLYGTGPSGGLDGGIGVYRWEPVAVLAQHGRRDTSTHRYTDGKRAFAVWAAINGCMLDLPDIDNGGGCAELSACGLRMAWCEHPGDHVIAKGATANVAEFFRSF